MTEEQEECIYDLLIESCTVEAEDQIIRKKVYLSKEELRELYHNTDESSDGYLVMSRV